MTGCICINGEFFNPLEARISPLDSGFLFGDGCFETLRTFQGQPFRLKAHLLRLEEASRTLLFAAIPSFDTLQEWTLETLRRSSLKEAVLRITVSRGMGSAGASPTVVIAALPLPHLNPEDLRGIRGTLLWVRDNNELPAPWVKSTSYQRSVLARHEVAKRGAQEGFYLASDGALIEGATSNLFFIVDGTLRTAPTTHCLPGITRAEVLSIAVEKGWPIREQPLLQAELTSASEAFISSSVAGLRPVISINEQRIGDGKPGPYFQTLLDAYSKRTTEETT